MNDREQKYRIRYQRTAAPATAARSRVPVPSPLIPRHYPLFLLLLLAGCSREIDTIYGQREGPGASTSVNGTAVFADMLTLAGHRVSSWSMLSPRLQKKADCIVWFPNDFQPPSEEVCLWLEDWLSDKPDRTLIYVGRDFDAAPWYWAHVLPDAPPEQRELVRQRLADANDTYTSARKSTVKTKRTDWFTLDRSRPLRKIKSLEGNPAWVKDINASRTAIELNDRLQPSESADVLLRSGDDMLISREPWDDSRLIVVTNGSFLLNLPLVNHEHRKLAGKLIAEIGEPAKNVVFLESYAGGPPIRGKDPDPSMPTGLEMFNIWPTNWILMHLAIVGVLFCFVRWPIFGRPKPSEPVGASDFGRHVDALALLLKRSGDRNYARSKMLQYRKKSEQE